MIVKLLTKHHLEFLRLKGCCRSLSESTHVIIPHCWKSVDLMVSEMFSHYKSMGTLCYHHP